MKHITTLLAIFCLFLNSAHAEVTEYDFELIIFEDTSGRYANSEQWQHELPGQDSSPDEAQRNPGTSAQSNEIINISQIEGIGLKKYANKLKSSKRYNVLVHKSWRQTGLADDAAIDMPVDSRPSNTVNSTGDVNNIHGSIKIVLGRYLHIYTDLIYQQPRMDTEPVQYGQSQQHKEYPINFHRRMRSKELHYLDHPLVGILVMAKPVKKQKVSQENT